MGDANDVLCSWLCHEGSQTGGEKEAGTCKGEEDAYLDEEIDNYCDYHTFLQRVNEIKRHLHGRIGKLNSALCTQVASPLTC